jgi:hypothetical protein
VITTRCCIGSREASRGLAQGGSRSTARSPSDTIVRVGPVRHHTALIDMVSHEAPCRLEVGAVLNAGSLSTMHSSGTAFTGLGRLLR